MHSGIAYTDQEKRREEDLHEASDIDCLGVVEKVEETHRDGDVSTLRGILWRGWKMQLSSEQFGKTTGEWD